LESSISSKKQTKTRRIVVKTNSLVHFLEEFTAWQFAFEINWPLAKVRILVTKYLKLSANVIYERTLICSSFLASISSFSCRLSIAALVSLRTCFNWPLAFSLVSVRLLILISASSSFSIWSLRSAKRLALKKVKIKYVYRKI
jgi:hypothetical protein